MTATSAPPVQVPDVSGNWQINSASLSAGASSASGIVLTGGLFSTGAVENESQSVTGTLNFGYLGPVTACRQPQSLTFTGTVDAARNFTLTSETLQGGGVVTVSMPLPETLSTYSTGGTIAISAGNCVQASQAVIGALQTPLSGTFTGTLYPGNLTIPEIASSVGASTVVLAETPIGLNGVEDFGLSGTFSYTIGTCTGSAAVGGTHNGIQIGLGTALTPAPSIHIGGGADSTGTTLQLDSIQFSAFPCSTNPTDVLVYNGVLTRQ